MLQCCNVAISKSRLRAQRGSQEGARNARRYTERAGSISILVVVWFPIRLTCVFFFARARFFAVVLLVRHVITILARVTQVHGANQI